MMFIVGMVAFGAIGGLVTLGLMSLAEHVSYRRRVARRLEEYGRIATKQEAR